VRADIIAAIENLPLDTAFIGAIVTGNPGDGRIEVNVMAPPGYPEIQELVQQFGRDLLRLLLPPHSDLPPKDDNHEHSSTSILNGSAPDGTGTTH
jgi:hypothetical protein